jgi:hypothetical protein
LLVLLFFWNPYLDFFAGFLALSGASRLANSAAIACVAEHHCAHHLDHNQTYKKAQARVLEPFGFLGVILAPS